MLGVRRENSRVLGSAGHARPHSAPRPNPDSEVRKVVTVLFADVTGSTPSGRTRSRVAAPAHLPVLRRDEMVVERHGGVVEKYIGDAVMAVFGVPKCTRTTRCAQCARRVEMRDALRG